MESQYYKTVLFALALFILFPMMSLAYERSIAPGVHNLDTGKSFATIVAAIADADTLDGHTLSVDPGTYHETVNVYKQLTIQSTSGDPSGTVVIGTDQHVFGIDAENVTISGFTMESGRQYKGVDISASYCTVSNCLIQENDAGIDANELYVMYGLQILNNTIIDNDGNGIDLYRFNNSLIQGNEIRSNAYFGMSLSHVDNSNILSNTVQSNALRGIEVFQSANCEFSDNTITDNGYYGFDFWNFFPITMRNNTISGHPCNIRLDDYCDQRLYDNIIDSDNTLDGKPMIYWVNEQDKEIPSDAGYVALIGCDNISAANLTIANVSNAILIYQTNNSSFDDINLHDDFYGIYMEESDNNSFSNINISGLTYDGIRLYGSDYNTFDNCTLNQCDDGIDMGDCWFNEIRSCSLMDISDYGIMLSLSSNNLIEENQIQLTGAAGIEVKFGCDENTITENYIDQTEQSGISLYNADMNVISGNYIDSVTGGFDYAGIDLTECELCLVIDNSVFNSTNIGIHLLETSNSIVNNNTIVDNFNEGIYLEHSPAVYIKYNFITGNRYGLHLNGDGNSVIQSNRLSGNHHGMILLLSDNNTLTENTFFDSTNQELSITTSNMNLLYHNDFLSRALNVYDDGNNTWNDGTLLEGNYWSTYAGEDLDGNGIGDTPHKVPPGHTSNYDNYPLMVPHNTTLFTDVSSISESAGGVVNFYVEAGFGNAGRNYLLAGGISGYEPGQPLPGGLVTLPVNFDAFTYFVVFPYLNTSLFMDFMGILDVDGRANPTVNAPPVPGFAGATMHFAYCCNNPFDFVSNAVAVEVVP